MSLLSFDPLEDRNIGEENFKMYLFTNILYNPLREGLSIVFNNLLYFPEQTFAFRLFKNGCQKQLPFSGPIMFYSNVKTIVNFLWNQSKYEYLIHSYFSGDRQTLLHAS